MKKLMNVVIPIILVIACVFTFAVTASAAGKDSAQVMGNVGRINEQMGSVFTEQYEMYQKRQTVFYCLVAIVLILGFSCVAYIFYAAPKCGMSRLWALMPLFSSVFGLIVFIVVSTQQKTRKTTAVTTCPTCGGKHPAGTGFCSICGTKL